MQIDKNRYFKRKKKQSRKVTKREKSFGDSS